MATTFTRTPNPSPRSDAEVAEILKDPGFGRSFTDHMVTIRWTEAEGWHETPTEFRLPFKILKNAGVAPPEIDLFHRRAALCMPRSLKLHRCQEIRLHQELQYCLQFQ